MIGDGTDRDEGSVDAELRVLCECECLSRAPLCRQLGHLVLSLGRLVFEPLDGVGDQLLVALASDVGLEGRVCRCDRRLLKGGVGLESGGSDCGAPRQESASSRSGVVHERGHGQGGVEAGHVGGERERELRVGSVECRLRAIDGALGRNGGKLHVGLGKFVLGAIECLQSRELRLAERIDGCRGIVVRLLGQGEGRLHCGLTRKRVCCQ